MINKPKFKISIQSYTRKEQNELIYKILRKYPFGLTYKELLIFAGISDLNALKKILKRLEKRKKMSVYIRKLGYMKLVYASIHVRKLRKLEEKWN